jgi:hypothetical protein
MIDLSTLPPLKGKKALVTGIANDQSIAWGCAKGLKAFGADLAITYLNDEAKPHAEPLAKEVEASIFTPLNVQVEGQLEEVFDTIKKQWGKLDICVHSIAFAPKADLQGRVVDCSKEGFLLAMGISCWSFIQGEACRAAHEGRRDAFDQPLAMVVVSPANALVPIVSAASLGFLALLGAIGAKAGGANILRATARVTFWGALADGTHRRDREAFRHGCLKIGAAQTSAPGTKQRSSMR